VARLEDSGERLCFSWLGAFRTGSIATIGHHSWIPEVGLNGIREAHLILDKSLASKERAHAPDPPIATGRHTVASGSRQPLLRRLISPCRTRVVRDFCSLSSL